MFFYTKEPYQKN